MPQSWVRRLRKTRGVTRARPPGVLKEGSAPTVVYLLCCFPTSCSPRLTLSPGVQILLECSVPWSQPQPAWATHCCWAGSWLSGADSSVACGLPALPPVRHSVHTGPVLGHSLDHIQEKEPPGLLLAPVLEPLLHLLERREGRLTGEGNSDPPPEGRGPSGNLRTRTQKAGLGGSASEDGRALGEALSAGRGVYASHSEGPRGRTWWGGRHPRQKKVETQAPLFLESAATRGLSATSEEPKGVGGEGSCWGLRLTDFEF